jgi:hypothetical protein
MHRGTEGFHLFIFIFFINTGFVIELVCFEYFVFNKNIQNDSSNCIACYFLSAALPQLGYEFIFLVNIFF